MTGTANEYDDFLWFLYNFNDQKFILTKINTLRLKKCFCTFVQKYTKIVYFVFI